MKTERKLKRGLKDVSPIFEIVPEEEALSDLIPQRSVHCISVYSADQPGDSFFLNTYVASQIASQNQACSIFSIYNNHLAPKPWDPQAEELNACLKRFNLSWEQFEEICAQPVSTRLPGPSQPQVLCLDLDYNQVPNVEKVFPVLDKWILFIQPTVQSLSEAYKLIKASHFLNSRLEYYLIFEGVTTDDKWGFLFERFSNMLSRHLGINPVCLGYLHPSKDARAFTSNLDLGNLFLDRFDPVDSPAKIALSEFGAPVAASAFGSAV